MQAVIFRVVENQASSAIAPPSGADSDRSNSDSSAESLNIDSDWGDLYGDLETPSDDDSSEDSDSDARVILGAFLIANWRITIRS